MGKIQVNAEVEVDIQQLLAQLGTEELEEFSREISAALSLRKSQDTKGMEAQLLQQLNEECILPETHWTAFNQLNEKKERGTLSQTELDAFAKLVEEEESMRLKRTVVLGELARIKQVPLPQLLIDLGITSPSSRK